MSNTVDFNVVTLHTKQQGNFYWILTNEIVGIPLVRAQKLRIEGFPSILSNDWLIFFKEITE
jgi:hypothetical protein